ncbi:MAG: aminoglycoside phosphotransferase family protein [Acaryochloridaceae cyanobacterium RL_2_7]|nr:aminoglycoside phosphotransferase family protein [Acaryochloridaceae cyanobacterium RL_2_7]
MTPVSTASRQESLASIALEFYPDGTLQSIHPLGNGNINDTYLVEVEKDTARKFVLQRINQQVFNRPQSVMDNICQMEAHITSRLTEKAPEQRWEIPQVLRTRGGKHHVVDGEGSVWRAIAFIDAAKTFDSLDSTHLAHEVGVGLGTFHNLIHDLPLDGMVDTLEGFHITPNYLAQYDEVCASNSIPTDPVAQYCKQFIRDRRAWAHVLELAKEQGKLKLQPIHGDPKVNNVMIDVNTGQAVSLIDLDTIKPGLIHYDIGDCLRSGCNPLGEETDCFEEVRFDLKLCQAILTGYSLVARDFLSVHDYDFLYDSIRLLAFELGLRFFSDYLNHNQYFKADSDTHNLDRAVVQFKLVESIEAQETDIRDLIDSLR